MISFYFNLLRLLPSFSGHAVWLTGLVPNQELNPGHGSETLSTNPLDCQGTSIAYFHAHVG